MPPRSSLISSPYANEHRDEWANGHVNGLDDTGGDVNVVVINNTGDTSPSASEDCSARYGAYSGMDAGPSSALSQSDEAEFAHPLINIEVEETSLTMEPSMGFLEDRAQSSDEKMEGSIASYDSNIEKEQASIHVAKRDQRVWCQSTLGRVLD